MVGLVCLTVIRRAVGRWIAGFMNVRRIVILKMKRFYTVLDHQTWSRTVHVVRLRYQILARSHVKHARIPYQVAARLARGNSHAATCAASLVILATAHHVLRRFLSCVDVLEQNLKQPVTV